MSMPKIEKSENPIDRNQSISNLIESVALMETGLSHIINAEGEKIQKVVKHDQDVDVPIEDIIRVNDSAQKMVNTVAKLEMILQNKLDISKDLDLVINPPAPIIEAPGSIIPYSGYVYVGSDQIDVPGALSIMIFGTNEPITLHDYDDINSLPVDTIVFPMPRSGNITGFSASFEIEEGAGPQMHLFAKIYKASGDDLYCTPVKDAVVEMIIPEGASSRFHANSNVSLNTPISVNDRLFVVFYCTTDGESAGIEGNAGVGISIQ